MILATPNGYLLGECISAWIKSVRRGDEEHALYFGLELASGFPGSFWKHASLLSVEDIGLGDTHAPVLIAALWTCFKNIREVQGKNKPVDENLVTMAIVYLCRAVKNREIDAAKNNALERRAKGFAPKIPLWAYDCHTQRGRGMGRTVTDWWNDCAWLPEGGWGKYAEYAKLKQRGEELPAEGDPER